MANGGHFAFLPVKGFQKRNKLVSKGKRSVWVVRKDNAKRLTNALQNWTALGRLGPTWRKVNFRKNWTGQAEG